MSNIAIHSGDIHHQFSGMISAVLADKLTREELVMQLLEMEKIVLGWYSSVSGLNEKYQALDIATQEILDEKMLPNSAEFFNLEKINSLNLRQTNRLKRKEQSADEHYRVTIPHKVPQHY